MKTLIAGIALAAAVTATPASALQLDSLKGLMGGGGNSLTSGTASNAAGILQYCMNNNYLSGGNVAGIKDQLLGSTGAKSQKVATQDQGYLDGARGLLKSGNGKTLDISGAGAAGDNGGTGDLKAQLTRKVCDAVLKQGQKMIGMGK